jgi:hypothetical protein
MRVYHRLIHIRDQKERHDDIPPHILDNPVFTLITKFRQHVQEKSAPITKVSQLTVGEDGMVIFAQLAQVLQEQNNIVMVYLVACILERLFGKGAIQDDLELIRGDLSFSDIIDGVSRPRGVAQEDQEEFVEEAYADEDSQSFIEHTEQGELPLPTVPNPIPPHIPSVFGGSTPSFGMVHPQGLNVAPPKNAFSLLVSTPSPFATSSIFGGTPSMSVFGSDQRAPVFPQPASSPIPPPSGKSSESMLQPHHFNGLASSQSPPSSFPPVPTVQPTPLATKSEVSFTLPPSRAVFDLPLPQPPPSETVPLNPTAPTFIPLIPSPPVPPLSSSSLPKATQPVPSQTPTAPKFSASPATRLAESSSPLPSPPLEGPQIASAARLVERRQTLWDLPGISDHDGHQESTPTSRLTGQYRVPKRRRC